MNKENIYKGKIGIVTLFAYYNYGNVLQNFASQFVYKKMGFYPILLVYPKSDRFKNYFEYLFRRIAITLNMGNVIFYKRFIRFYSFVHKNLNIQFLDRRYMYKKGFADRYAYFSIGSDQVWNPIDVNPVMFLDFAPIGKKICMSPSFGVSEIPAADVEMYSKGLRSFKSLTVREDAGKELIRKISGKEAVVLPDPTMALTKEEWLLLVDQKAKKTDDAIKEGYILCYFLGKEHYRSFIQSISTGRSLKIVDISDRNSEAYTNGPIEFIWLIDHARLVCTDSYHGMVFSMIMNTPFVGFIRNDSSVSMISRVETLLRKFGFCDRLYRGEGIKAPFFQSFEHSNMILKDERKRFYEYFAERLEEN